MISRAKSILAGMAQKHVCHKSRRRTRQVRTLSVISVVPGDVVGDSMTVDTVSDSRSGITCLSERLARQMEQHFRGERLVRPCVKEMSVKLANVQKVVVRNQTSTLQVAIGTPWGSLVISTAFAVTPGIGSVLILGSKTLREKLGTAVMASLKCKA